MIDYLASLTIILVLILSAFELGKMVLYSRRAYFDQWEWFLFAVSIGFAVIGYAIYLLGLLSVLKPSLVWIFAGLPALASLRWIGKIRPAQFTSFLSWTKYEIIAAVLLIGTVVMYGISAGSPPMAHDALAYHLAMPKRYLSDGSISFFPFVNASLWPALMEMLYVVPVMTGRSSGAQIIHWFMGILVIGWIYKMGMIYYNRLTGLIAANIVVHTVLFKILSTTALIDLGFCSCALLGLYALLKYRSTNRMFWLVLAGVEVGLSGTIKLTGVVWLAALMLSLFFFRTKKAAIKDIMYECSLMAGISMALMSPWLIRSFWHTGNPVWPFFSSLFGGGGYWDAAQTRIWLRFGAENIGARSLAESVLRKVYNLLKLSGTSDFYPGVFCIVFAGIAGIRRKKLLPPALHSLYIILIMYFVAYLTIMPESVRYLVPLFPIAGLAIAGYAYALIQRGKYVKMAGCILVLLLIGYKFPVFDRQLRLKMYAGLGHPGSGKYLQGMLDIYPMSQWINNNLSSGDTVLFLNEIRGFYIEHNYVWGDPVNQKYINYDQLKSVDDLVRRWQTKGITHVLVKGKNVFWPIEGGEHVTAFLSSAKAPVHIGNYYLFTAGE